MVQADGDASMPACMHLASVHLSVKLVMEAVIFTS
jgi:hypothetical protein